MDIKQLTAEEKAALLAQLEEDKRAEAQRIEEERATYKDLRDETVKSMFAILQEASRSLVGVKRQVFDGFETLVRMKDDLYSTRSGRQTDTFSTHDGSISIKLGNRTNEGWDDTVETGIGKVKEYLKTLAKDENSANLVETVMGLLARDRKGSLKASKVLELERLAVKSGDAVFMEGLDIIRKAYRPAATCRFIEVRYKDANGREHNLPLSMSAID